MKNYTLANIKELDQEIVSTKNVIKVLLVYGTNHFVLSALLVFWFLHIYFNNRSMKRAVMRVVIAAISEIFTTGLYCKNIIVVTIDYFKLVNIRKTLLKTNALGE